LKFELAFPQAYQYEYVATADAFTVFARADFDDDGDIKTWSTKGHVERGHVVLDSFIAEPPY
jgi:hypothetical protein